MIFGSLGEDINVISPAEFYATNWGVRDMNNLEHEYRKGRFTLAMTSSNAPSHDAGHILYHNPDAAVTIAVYGHIFNIAELARQLGSLFDENYQTSVGMAVFHGYEKEGAAFFRKCNGNFVIVIRDERKNRLWIVRDHLGIESLYFYRKNQLLYFSSNLHQLAASPLIDAGLNSVAVLRYLLFNYNPYFDSMYEDIQKLRPGYMLRIEDGKMIIDPYWYISFKDPFKKTNKEYKEELIDLFNDSIRLRLDDKRFRTGVYLSGGMDSSTITGLMRPMIEGPVHSFSFRCRGKTFDESYYARFMSESYNTTHHEVPYEAEDVHRIAQVAAAADEPFSDIGIEVASYLLAEKASGVVDYVLTGDGGDELFAGHPVYQADTMAEKFERIPKGIRTPFTNLLQKLPDTEAKKSLLVKAKRFSYSAGFSSDLFSNRWRIYYTDAELKHLLTPDWYHKLNKKDALQDIKNLYHEADGSDFLSKTIYGDYYTVMGFYLRRMELTRKFGLEGRFPLLDYRLVEYTSRIPSNLKLDEKGQTKAIFHKVMAGVLPDEIVFRTDKLGHSVPFKNWLRHKPIVQNVIREHLTPEAISKRGIFENEFVQTLFKRHISKADNNSHRLWALLTFELWCREHLDNRKVEKVVEAELA
ncbi:MAG: hypothetical protein H6696_15605 [Deferribacteres bacterium]|nr:hypothetical protein [candidate division KSB1 bacterium]MCB9503355.1 hypothetical protein [Deferribacteres bacterium]